MLHETQASATAGRVWWGSECLRKVDPNMLKKSALSRFRLTQNGAERLREHLATDSVFLRCMDGVAEMTGEFREGWKKVAKDMMYGIAETKDSVVPRLVAAGGFRKKEVAGVVWPTPEISKALCENNKECVDLGVLLITNKESWQKVNSAGVCEMLAKVASIPCDKGTLGPEG